MKGCLKRMLSALLCAMLGIFTLTACTSEKVDLELIGEPTLTVAYDEDEKLYYVTLEGLAKNGSGKNCEDAQIEVKFYDNVGDPIGTESEYMDYIDAGETWHFYIERMYEHAPTRFEIEDAYVYVVEEE